MRGRVGTLLLVVLVAVWFAELRPQALGGPAAYLTVAGASMEPTMHGGDLVVVRRREAYRTGDVVAFRIPEGQPAAGRVVIHRIVGGNAREGFRMKGDNRQTQDAWRPRAGDVMGTPALHVAGVGRAARKLLTPLGLAILAGLTTALLVLAGGAPREQTTATA